MQVLNYTLKRCEITYVNQNFILNNEISTAKNALDLIMNHE